MLKKFYSLALLIALMAIVIACSSSKNTAKSRWWQSFNTRYNVYYNGNLAYIDGALEKEKGNVDDYTEVLPLYTVGNEKSKTLGSGNFDRAIEKCEKAIKLHSIKKRPEWNKNRKKTEKEKEWLSRKEYNPFIWKAWFMMGRSQYMKGEFEQAAATFAYMSRLFETQPKIYGIAQAWLARCYVENEWFYEAEDIIRNLKRDSIYPRAQKELIGTEADLYIKQELYEKAVPYLKEVIKNESRRLQRARENFLLGQIQSLLGHNSEAYKSFQRVIRSNPPYQLEFCARIAQTEVMAESNVKGTLSKLRRMARSDKNKDYLDQVYYAMGNVYMLQNDTANAISSYEKGIEKATRSGTEKGVLCLTLGNLYWNMEKFADAQRCYSMAVGMLDKKREGYEELSKRSEVLDELVPHTESVHLQDSLQALAKLDSIEIIKVIDRVIEELKKKEEEERLKAEEAETEQQLQKQNAMGNSNTMKNKTATPTQQKIGNGQWYFYNPQAIQQGKTQFQKLWGKRDNQDDWQRNNRTNVSSDILNETDSILTQNHDSVEITGTDTPGSMHSLLASEDTVNADQALLDSLAQDPHNREYYWAQIPFTEEQIAESNLLIMDGLYNSGVIFKDKLDNLKLSEKALTRLENQYPDFVTMDDAYYHLFLLYSRKEMHDSAQTYVDKLKEKFPESQWTTLLSDPYFVENQKFGVHIEDSLYAGAYDAFKANRFDEVAANTKISETRFPLGANRAKFIFFDGMRKLSQEDQKGCLENMKEIVEKHPKSEVAQIAGSILNGVKEGKTLQGGGFDALSIWERRTAAGLEEDSTEVRKALSTERETAFVFMLAYPEDSINENQLLYDLAKYNFTNYLVRNFEITIERENGIGRMMIKGFQNYDEAWQYTHQVTNAPEMSGKLQNARILVISEENMALLGVHFSFNDYDEFYNENFAPLPVSTEELLQEPEKIQFDDIPDDVEVEGLEDDKGNDQDVDSEDDWEKWF